MNTVERAARVLAAAMTHNSWAGHRVAATYNELVGAIRDDDYKPWTVLMLRPDHMWDGSTRDWTYQAHVYALDVAGAEIAGREQAAKVDGIDEPFDYAVLAVYDGHLSDVADT